MMETYTLNKAIQCACNEALRKIVQKKLFKSCDESDASQDFSSGDPETLYSIASMYGQLVTDVDVDIAVSKIENVLLETFPKYN